MPPVQSIIYTLPQLSEFSRVTMRISHYLMGVLPEIESREGYYQSFLLKLEEGASSIDHHLQSLQAFKGVLECLNQADLITLDSLEVLKNYPLFMPNIYKLFNHLQEGHSTLIPIFLKQLKTLVGNQLIRSWVHLVIWMKASNTLSDRLIRIIFEQPPAFFDELYNLLGCIDRAHLFSKSKDKDNQWLGDVISSFLQSPSTLSERYKLIKYLKENSILTKEALIAVSKINFSKEARGAIWEGLLGLGEISELQIESVQAIFNIVLKLQGIREVDQNALMNRVATCFSCLRKEEILNSDILKQIEASPNTSVELLMRFQRSKCLIADNISRIKVYLAQPAVFCNAYQDFESIQVSLNRLLFSRPTLWINDLLAIIASLKQCGLWATSDLKKDMHGLCTRGEIRIYRTVLTMLGKYSTIQLDSEVHQCIIRFSEQEVRSLRAFLELQPLKTILKPLAQEKWLKILQHPNAVAWLLHLFTLLSLQEPEGGEGQTYYKDVTTIISVFLSTSTMEEGNDLLLILNTLQENFQEESQFAHAAKHVFRALQTLESMKERFPNSEIYLQCKQSIFENPECAPSFSRALTQFPEALYSDVTYWTAMIQYPAFSQEMGEAYQTLTSSHQTQYLPILQYPMCASQMAKLINQNKINDEILSLLDQCFNNNPEYVTQVADALCKLPKTLWGKISGESKPIISDIVLSIAKRPQKAVIIANAAIQLLYKSKLNSETWAACRQNPMAKTVISKLFSTPFARSGRTKVNSVDCLPTSSSQVLLPKKAANFSGRDLPITYHSNSEREVTEISSSPPDISIPYCAEPQGEKQLPSVPPVPLEGQSEAVKPSYYLTETGRSKFFERGMGTTPKPRVIDIEQEALKV